MQRMKHLEHTPISELILMKSKGELAMPDVQRELVWSKSQKQMLIDSLLRDYDLPKFYFRDMESDDKQLYHVIDGQQRLNAIFAFVNGEYELSPDADDVDGEVIAGKRWQELSSYLQSQLYNRCLDIVHLIGYTDEEIDEMYLRLQNGTPLKAPEKRRAIAGNMRVVVGELAKHNIFKSDCAFSNKHYAYEDVVTKIMKQIADGRASDISASALKRMYEQNAAISSKDKLVQDTKRALNFLKKAFHNTSNPHLKRYAVIDLAVVANSFLNSYDVNRYAQQFGEAFLQFANDRALNAEKPDELQDQRLIRYGNATRGDSLEYLEYRQRVLKEYILEAIPQMARRDHQRKFTPDQRAVIYRLGEGRCAGCGISVSEDDFEADHIKPWGKGGQTIIANGQILCAACNLLKSDKYEEPETHARIIFKDQFLE